MRHRLRRDSEEVTGLTAPEIDREGMAPTTDEPVLVSNLNRLIAEDRQIVAQRDLVTILIEDRDHRALPRRQVPEPWVQSLPSCQSHEQRQDRPAPCSAA